MAGAVPDLRGGTRWPKCCGRKDRRDRTVIARDQKESTPQTVVEVLFISFAIRLLFTYNRLNGFGTRLSTDFSGIHRFPSGFKWKGFEIRSAQGEDYFGFCVRPFFSTGKLLDAVELYLGQSPSNCVQRVK
jgi:hypothetical protein